jgi:hypothetical protein
MERNWSILLYKEHHKGRSKWFAMTLEHMVAWWAATPQAALLGLIEALKWQIEADTGFGQVPFALCPRAPERYWKLYQEGALAIQLSPETTEIPGNVRLAA